MKLASTTHPGNPDRNLLIVHGYTGSSDDFDHVVSPLASAAAVTTVDLPGHGQSARLDRYSYDAAVRELGRFAESEFGTPFDILGHSMGGRIVLQLAIARPELFRSLILMDTWADAPDRGGHAAALAAAFARPEPEIPGALAALDRDTGERALLTERWGEPWLDHHHEYNQSHLDPRALVDYGRLVFFGTEPLLEEARSITAAVTVLVGSEDHPMLAASARLAATIPAARLVTIDGAYHSPQLTHPVQWQSAIAAHLART